MIERFVAADGADADVALVVPVLQVHAAQARACEVPRDQRSGSQRPGRSATSSRSVSRDSTTTLATVTLGGDYVRARTEARLSGQGGTTKQVALYFAGGNQMHDFRTIQDHDAPNTTSDLLFKGAVQDSAASVYTGIIMIREHANGTVAIQTNRNLTLSEGAWAESVPEPRHRDERRQVQPCLHRRPDRRGPALLSREPRCPPRGRRTTRRARLLR